MRIGVISDIHLEFRKTDQALQIYDIIQKTDVDFLINAGDTHPRQMMRDFANEQFKVGKGFYIDVLGNHDFYGGQMIQDDFQVGFLPDQLKVVGCTFWTDFNSGDPSAEAAFRHQIVDNFQIKPGSFALIERMKEIHKSNLDAISREKPDIVVTHYAPSFQSVHARYKGSGAVNYSFVSDEENFILANPNIKLWVHGHTHNPVDYYVGNTRVISNQLGYPGEVYPSDTDYAVKVLEL